MKETPMKYAFAVLAGITLGFTPIIWATVAINPWLVPVAAAAVLPWLVHSNPGFSKVAKTDDV